MTFIDGDRITPGTEGCACGSDCEMPCWQRVGLTDRPCCRGCAPLPTVMRTELDVDGRVYDGEVTL